MDGEWGHTFSYQASKSDSLSLEGEMILEDTQRSPAPEVMVKDVVGWCFWCGAE